MSSKMGGITAALLKQVAKDEVSCPTPTHVAPWICAGAFDMSSRVKQSSGNAVSPSEDDEAGYEILEILSRKTRDGYDQREFMEKIRGIYKLLIAKLDDDIEHRLACTDVGVSGSPIPFCYGSPPTRASNPLVNDVQFIQKKETPLPFYLGKNLACQSGGSPSLKKPSCGTPYGLKPCVRIEGFLSSKSDAHRNVLAFA